MKIRRAVGLLLALVALGAAMPAGATSPGGSRAPEPKPGCHATTDGYECFYGPIKVKGNGEPTTPSGEYGIVPAAAPAEAGFITWMRATLVDGSGDLVSHHAVHLHHAVWLNPNRTDMTCTGTYAWPDRFFASGAERTKITLPDGYGYYWDNQPPPQPYPFSEPTWLMNYHLDGMHPGTQTVYLRLRMGLETGPTAPPMFDVQPVWLDVDGNCSDDSEFDVDRNSGDNGPYKKTWTYTMPRDGNFLAMAGHLHEGGIRLKLTNTTTGERMFVSTPTYRRGELRKMTSFSDADGPAVSAGDVLELTAVYDDSKRRKGVMGIMLGALAPAS